MFCIGCGEKLPTNARYCPKCGEKIFDSPSVGDSSNIKFLHEQSQEIDTILNNLESPKEQDHLEQPNLNTVMNPVKQKLDITALGLVLLILICVFVIAKFSDSNSKPSTTTKPQVIVEENKPPKIDCSKVGNNPSFGEMDACNLKSSSSTTYKPKTSNSSSSKPVAKSVVDICSFVNFTNIF